MHGHVLLDHSSAMHPFVVVIIVIIIIIIIIIHSIILSASTFPEYELSPCSQEC